MLKKNIKVLLVLLSILLFFLIFRWIHYLITHNYIREYYTDLKSQVKDTDGFTTSQTVDLPLTTKFSCTNMCINARCSKSKEQCLSDIDCPGCQPYIPPFSKFLTKDIVGNNASGKMTVGPTPTYSVLTTDIGTQSTLYLPNNLKGPPHANFGINTWKNSFSEQSKLFNNRYNLDNKETQNNYAEIYTVTGEFMNIIK